jgi:hypothetical protein
MKKTGKIQLVLITAALASCDREIAPRQSLTAYPAGSTFIGTPDTTLTAGPVYDTDPYDYSLWNYSFNLYTNFYYISPNGKSYYYPGNRYRKGFFRKSDHFIVRGGWGKAGHSVSS